MKSQAPTIFPRSLFLLSSFCTLGLAISSPTSLTATLAERAGPVGDLAAMTFGAASVVLLLDMIINDLMPEKFKFTFARKYRWLFVSNLAIVYWMFGTLALLPGASPEGSWVLILSYFGIGGWGMTFAFHTKLTRYRNEVAVQNEPQNSQLA